MCQCKTINFLNTACQTGSFIKHCCLNNMYPLPVLVTTGKMQLERGHRPLNLLRLITHTETEGWEGWGQRAPHTHTCASPKPLLHLSTPMFLPRPTPSSTTHPTHWSAALLLIFCCSSPPFENWRNSSSEIQMTLLHDAPHWVALLLRLNCD